MLKQASPRSIANIYTAAEIKTKIDALMESIEAASFGGYTLNNAQDSQSVNPADLDKMQSLLAIWVKAYAIKTGTYKGTQFVSVNYTP